MAQESSPTRKVRADFDGLFGELLCLLHSDTGLDESWAVVHLQAGMAVTAFDEDANELGVLDDLISTGYFPISGVSA